MTFAPIVATSLASQLAELAISPGRVALVPVAPLAWGHDLSCVTDCDELFSETPQGSPLIVAQAVVRRWTTSRGALLDDADYGFNVLSYLNRGLTQDDIRTLQRKLVAEAQKEERVQTCEVQLTVPLIGAMDISARITLADPRSSAFRFVLAVDGPEVLLTLIGT